MPHRFAQRSVHQHRPAATSGAVKGAVRWRAMTKDRSTAAKAGGFLIATGVLLGAVGGVIVGQASAGFLLGLAAGAGLALFLWWRDRRRQPPPVPAAHPADPENRTACGGG